MTLRVLPRRRALSVLVVLGAASGLARGQSPSTAGTAPAPLSMPMLSSYRLGAGDVIGVNVFDEPEFSREQLRLNDVGSISLPLVGEIPVLGLTTGEAERAVADKLRGRILKNPVVSVTLQQYRTFFIQGQVRAPGSYPYMPGLTVRKASILAGGFAERASMSKIFLIRDKDPVQAQIKASIDSVVGPGDVIFVGETFF